MKDKNFVEAVLERVHTIERRIERMSYAEAVDFAHLISREMPEEALRMLTAELLLEHWRDTHGRGITS
jgi:hypothetical protein